MKNIVVFGTGGHGREVMWQLNEYNKSAQEYNILGFVDDDKEKQGSTINGFTVVGDTDWLLSATNPICVAIALGKPSVRRTVAERLSKNEKIEFPNIIASDARISDTVKLGKGCIIGYSCILTVNIEIGDFFIINVDSTVSHDCVIGNYVTLNSSINVSGNVKIGSGTDVGVGTSIIQGITIGSNTIIGAGAAVVKNIPNNCTAVGVPAKPIKFHINKI